MMYESVRNGITDHIADCTNSVKPAQHDISLGNHDSHEEVFMVIVISARWNLQQTRNHA